MKSNDARVIHDYLFQRNNYGECIIYSLEVMDFGTTIRIQLNYIWDSKGKVRTNLDEPLLVTMFFRLTQLLLIDNAMNQTQVLHTDELNWGFNEIALMNVVQNSNLTVNLSHLPIPYTHVALMWESNRRIDIVFSEFEVQEPQDLQDV